MSGMIKLRKLELDKSYTTVRIGGKGFDAAVARVVAALVEQGFKLVEDACDETSR